MRLVFSDPRFAAMAVAISVTMAFVLSVMSEYLFLEPYFVGHVPKGTELGFILVAVIAILSGIVIPANIFRVIVLHRSRQKMGSGLAGSMIGTAAGACSCGPVGFAVISTFGTVGATTTAFLTAYEVPLRIVAIVILAVTFVATYKSINAECRI